MGCHASKDVMQQMQEQEKKIDELIKLNQTLQNKVKEMQSQPIPSPQVASKPLTDNVNLISLLRLQNTLLICAPFVT